MHQRKKHALSAALAGGLIATVLATVPAQATALGATSPGAEALVLPAQAQQPPNVESSIALLHQRLAITPAQEGAFAAFANVMRENARASASGQPPTSADAIYQLRYAIQYAQQEVDGMRRMLPVLERLYAVLSPQQRAAADQLFRQGPGR